MQSKKALIESWKGKIPDYLIEAFESVLREEFIPEELLNEAYGDYPLPIGRQQTISQPSTVMLMLKFLDLGKGHSVLEVGAGSGYNAAIMSKIAKHVTAIEIIPELAQSTKLSLKRMKYDNVEVVLGDGSSGYRPNAPYDRIIVTAACPVIPQPLLEQLTEEGVIVAPVGQDSQRMMVGRKHKGVVTYEDMGGFVFVPLKGLLGFT